MVVKMVVKPIAELSKQLIRLAEIRSRRPRPTQTARLATAPTVAVPSG